MTSLVSTIVLAVLACAWLVAAAQMMLGMRRLPRLEEAPPLADADCPSVSILVAARDEEARLPAALATLVAQDYPRCEVVAVDDRSRDATPRILDEAARAHPHLKVLHLTELPRGWLGKPHALTEAYKQSSGEWLVFTDADVRFAPDLVRRAVSLAREHVLDHVTVLPTFENPGFWERVFFTYGCLGMYVLFKPWNTTRRGPGQYNGVGAFQMLRREAYEALGTHRSLAMEVIEDVKLGKLVKRHGFRSGTTIGYERLKLRYEEGLGSIIRAFTKNSFAAMRFSVSLALAGLAALLGASVLPFAALAFTEGTPRLLAGIAALTAAGLQAWVGILLRFSPLYGLTHPLGALIFAYSGLRSMVVTLRQGGVRWRDTFYPLDELRKGQV